MIKNIDPQDLEAAAHALIKARETSLGIEVSMPVIYPDGSAVTVVVTVEGGDYVVHDAGFGVMYLTSAGVKLTKKLERKLTFLAAQYGCEFIEGRMTRRCSVEQIALAIAIVANASRTVGDQSLETRHGVERDFREEVSQRLREIVGSRIRAQQEVKGASGRLYRVGNVVLNVAQTTPVAFVESFANRAGVANHFMEFFDLRPAYPEVGRYSVYDQNEPFTKPELNLLREVSQVVSYGQSRQALAVLRSA